MSFLIILGNLEITSRFKLVKEQKMSGLPDSTRLEFSKKKKISPISFALSNAEDNASGPLHRGGIEPNFLEVMDSLVLIG